MSTRTTLLFTALSAIAITVSPHAMAQRSSSAPPVSAPTAASCTDGRGPTSAFFCAPLVNNESVRACATNASGNALAQCQQASAASFCRTRSYGAAAAYQVTASGNLAEVLCRTPMGMAAAAPPATRSAPPQVAPAPVAAGPTAIGNVYETIDWGQLTVTTWGPSNFAATYTHDDGGTVTGQRNGMTIDGVWSQTSSAQRCDTQRGGTFYHGRMTFTFSAELDSFAGLWSYCDGVLDQTWNGNLLSRSEASVRASAAISGAGVRAANSMAPVATASTSANKPKKARGGDTVADRLARQAADEAERKAGDKVREGVSKALDGVLPF